MGIQLLRLRLIIRLAQCHCQFSVLCISYDDITAEHEGPEGSVPPVVASAADRQDTGRRGTVLRARVRPQGRARLEELLPAS